MKKKVIVLITSLLLIGAIYYFFTNQNKNTNQITPQPTSVSDTSDKTEILEVTINFYKNYDSCMKNPPAQAAEKVGEYCQNNTGLTTISFASNLEKGGIAKAGADPIYCAQNTAEEITVLPDVEITAAKAVIFVNKKMGPTQIKIQADLLKDNGNWKIDNIICPSNVKEETISYVNNTQGYSLYLPKSYQVSRPTINETSIISNGENPNSGIAWINTEPANERTADQVVNKVIADLGEGFNIKTTIVTIDNTQAIVADYLPGQDPTRQLFMIHNNTLYRITFSPDDPQAGDYYKQMEDIYKMIIETFHFIN